MIRVSLDIALPLVRTPNPSYYRLARPFYCLSTERSANYHHVRVSLACRDSAGKRGEDVENENSGITARVL